MRAENKHVNILRKNTEVRKFDRQLDKYIKLSITFLSPNSNQINRNGKNLIHKKKNHFIKSLEIKLLGKEQALKDLNTYTLGFLIGRLNMFIFS